MENEGEEREKKRTIKIYGKKDQETKREIERKKKRKTAIYIEKEK